MFLKRHSELSRIGNELNGKNSFRHTLHLPDWLILLEVKSLDTEDVSLIAFLMIEF